MGQFSVGVNSAAPKGTPPAVVARLERALNEVLADGSFKSKALGMGIETEASSSPAAVKALVQSEIDKWRPIIKATGRRTSPVHSARSPWQH